MASRSAVSPVTAAASHANSALRWLGDSLLAWVVPLAILVLWSLNARWNWVPEQVLPSPVLVLQTLAELIRSGELWPNLAISLQRVLGGFAVGAALGLALGVGMGLSRRINAYVFPFFKAFAQVPVIGWLPLLMLMVGIGEALKILLIAKAALVPMAINTCRGIQGVPASYAELGKLYRYSTWQLLRRVVFPAAVAPIWTGVRYGFTNAWLALVVVELLASSEGIGYLVIYGRQLFQLELVLAAVLVLAVVGFLIDRLLEALESRVLRWQASSGHAGATHA